VLGGKIPADTTKIDDLAKLKWFWLIIILIIK
jgi:hypothetical protein